MSTLSLWTRRDPFTEFDALVRTAFGPAQGRPAGFTPAAEVTRDGDDAVVRVELPGLDVEKDVTVEVDRGRLVVRGERRDTRTAEQGGRSLREVRYGSFQRSFRLPGHVTADAVSAAYDAGVLTVRVAGAHAGTDARRIAVTSGPAAVTGPADERPADQAA
ncbi:Hsp20/alpha crystallin family protein [Solwaraspora sp. WMMD1047]|uniref:Hsp20/alpha crystallin family protein n=1 Tax=Solwaraspora sp. WMMD1047 TaxID=3016102 RepID=UPI0024178D11|nr:Hsp20/alpha crystallin family protein [Solwaraspora sp. WMMD1047]MDG4832811.1 Hsp20/alpha crystallin family protein [Solwaraspora sp. WMMD1047]